MSFFWPVGQAKRDPIPSHDVGEKTETDRAGQPGGIIRNADLERSRQTSMVQKDSEREDTAHDRAVRELLGLGPDIPSSNSNNAGGLPNERAAAVTGSATLNVLNSESAAFPPGPERVYDPATGSLAGFIRQKGDGNGTGDVGGVQNARSGGTRAQEALSQQQQQQRSGNDTTAGEAQPQSSKNASFSEDMWNQLSKIRVLQSDIARMHLALDKPGIIEGVKSRRGTTNTRPGSIRANTNDTLAVPISSRSGGGAGAGVDSGVDAAGKSEQPTVPEDEFAKRKASIGAIMTKLNALSVAVTEFHTLPTPPLDFPSPSSATSSRANSLQPFLDRDNKNNTRRKIFSEPSLMSNVTLTSRPPSADTKDHFKPPSSTLNTAPPIPAVTRTGTSTSAGLVDRTGSELGVGTTTPVPSASSLLPAAGAQRRLPSPLTINPYSRMPNVEPSQSSTTSAPPSARLQPESQSQTHSYGQGQRLGTLYEPQGEPAKSSEAAPLVPATPVVSVERVIDGVPTGNFRLTSRHESPLGTPTSLLRRSTLQEEGPANGARAAGENDNSVDAGLGDRQG